MARSNDSLRIFEEIFRKLACTTELAINIILEGPVVPYTRMTQRTKWTKRSQRYLNWKAVAATLMRQQAGDTFFERKTPVSVTIDLLVSKRIMVKDIDNLAKAILDALEYSGIIHNDNQVHHLSVIKAYGVSDVAYIHVAPFSWEFLSIPTTSQSPR